MFGHVVAYSAHVAFADVVVSTLAISSRQYQSQWNAVGAVATAAAGGSGGPAAAVPGLALKLESAQAGLKTEPAVRSPSAAMLAQLKAPQ